jgi:flagellar motility protein MotE (MotC chaperone)
MKTYVTSFPSTGFELKRVSREKTSERARMRRRERDLTEIKTKLAGLHEEMKAAVELLQKHQSRFTAQESRIAAQDNRIDLLRQTVWGMLNGRVWRSLELIGRLPRKLFKRT